MQCTVSRQGRNHIVSMHWKTRKPVHVKNTISSCKALSGCACIVAGECLVNTSVNVVRGTTEFE